MVFYYWLLVSSFTLLVLSSSTLFSLTALTRKDFLCFNSLIIDGRCTKVTLTKPIATKVKKYAYQPWFKLSSGKPFAGGLTTNKKLAL